MDKTRALVVGLGSIGYRLDGLDLTRVTGRSHAGALSLSKEFDLVGGVDVDTRARNKFEKIYSAPSYSSTTEAILASQPSLVVIAASTDAHLQVLQEILRVHTPRLVVCEKPMGGSLNDAQAIFESCKSKDINLLINYFRRADPAVRTAKTLVQANDGLRRVTGVCFFTKGVKHNASHFVDLCSLFLGSILSAHALKVPCPGDSGSDCERDFLVEFYSGNVIFRYLRDPKLSHVGLQLVSTNSLIELSSTEKHLDVVSVKPSAPHKTWPGFLGWEAAEFRAELNHESYMSDFYGLVAAEMLGERTGLATGLETLNMLEALEQVCPDSADSVLS